MKKIIVLILLSCCTFLFGAEKLDIKKIEELFDKKGQWCFLTTQKSKYNRLSYVDKHRYKLCKEGDLFKKISYKGKYYARGLDKKIYKPHWQMKKDFSTHLVPAKKYIASLNTKIKTLKTTIQKSNENITKTQKSLEDAEIKYEKVSVYKKHSRFTSRWGAKVRALKKIYKKRKKEYESKVKNLKNKQKRSENELRELQAFEQKTESLYKKYAIAKK